MADSGFRYRRRMCLRCGHRWNTYETRINPRQLRLASPPRPAPVPEPEPEPRKLDTASSPTSFSRPFLAALKYG